MRNRHVLAPGVALAIGLLLWAAPADADVQLTYDGSFNAASGYYPRAMAFVPDGTGSGDRPEAVTGPTIVTAGGHGTTDYLREFYIPALVTSGSPNSATQVLPANGGTFVDETGILGSAGGWTSMEIMGGVIWGLRGSDFSSNFGVGVVKMGTNEVWAGGSTGVSRLQPWGVSPGSSYSGFGVANKWDETNTLVTTDWNYRDFGGGDLGYQVYVTKQVQGAPDIGDSNVFAWTSSNVFSFMVDDTDDDFNTEKGSRWFTVEYLQIGSTKYYVLTDTNTKTSSSTLMFFDASTATGLVGGPDFTLNLQGYIEGGVDGVGSDGVGWWQSNSNVTDLSWDAATNTLYVLDANTSGGSAASRIHVFSLDPEVVPEPATLALLSVGGLLGLTRLARRRRRA